MIVFHDLDITATHGDTTAFTLDFVHDAPEDGTKVLFTIRDNSHDGNTFVRKIFEVRDASLKIYMSAAEARNIPVGTYIWDIRYLHDDGEVYTPMFAAKYTCVEASGRV